MQPVKLNGTVLYEMLRGGLEFLEENRAAVDVLNVFPVPDGDTGTNMVLTLKSAVKEMEKSGSANLSELAQAVSLGSLMGARGNSGVILSQFFRGLAKGLEGQAEAGSRQFAQAMQMGVKAAYKAVMKPVEGTILTVAREAVAGALAAAETEESIALVLDALLGHGEEALAHTPDLLPVLKKAGVVDAGGKGFVLIWAGARLVLQRLADGDTPVSAAVKDPEKEPDKDTIKDLGTDRQTDPEMDAEIVKDKDKDTVKDPATDTDIQDSRFRESDGSTTVGITEPQSLISDQVAEQQLQYQYCTETIVKGSGLPLEQLRRELTGLGDSMLVVGTDRLIKVHIHTNHPGQVLETCLQYGSLHQLKIDNMQEQHREFSGLNPAAEAAAPQPIPVLPVMISKQIGLVTVTAGAGLAEILESLGVDQVVIGGQSMNPSIEDLVQAVDRIESTQVIILPNNPNIILAAEQAAAICSRGAKEVRVVPTRSLAQTIGALVAFDPEASLKTNLTGMLAGSSRVKSGEVTYAVRDCQLDGLDILAGQIIGIYEKDIKAAGDDVSAVVLDLLKNMVTDENELISLFYGEGVENESAGELAEQVRELFPACEIELHSGGQPLYFYFISVE